MLRYQEEGSKASVWKFSGPKGNAHTFTYLYNFLVLHNTDFQLT